MDFCNEYKMDVESICETTTAWHKNQFTSCKAWVVYLALSVFTAAVLLFCVFRTIDVSSIVFSMVLSVFMIGIAVVVTCKAATKKSVKAQTERLEMLYRNETAIISIVLQDAQLTYSAAGLHKTLQYVDILNVIQSNHFIILVVKGSATLALKKDGFTRGSANECLAFLNDVMQKKKQAQ